MTDWNSEDFSQGYALNLEFEQARMRKRRKRDLIDELLSEVSEPPAQHPVANHIDRYFQERLDASRRRFLEIRREVDSRRALSRAFREEIDSQISYAQLSLEEFSGWGVGYNTGVDVKRNHLERQLQQLRSERRSSQLQAWTDFVRLRKDLREALLDYQAAARLDHSGGESNGRS